MMINRRDFLLSAGAAGTWAMAPRFAFAQSGKKRVLKYIPATSLTLLDPIVTTAAVTMVHGYCVFDTLYGVNGKLEPKPQMADGAEESADGLAWTIRLREGLLFHDGKPVRAQDCVASIERWSQRDISGQGLAAAVAAYETPDERTLVIKLKRPFPRMLEVLGKPHSSPAFIMPERLARTSPTTPITEMVGSGPLRFVASEYVIGSKVVYEKFEQYKPRAEAADWTSGGKVINFDRLEWLIIPDAATAAAALQNGEVDWWDSPLPDLLPMLQSDANIALPITDPYGLVAVMRFNSAQAPFNNVKARRAANAAVDQMSYMQALGLPTGTYNSCLSNYPCGLPGVKSDLGEKPGGIDHARALLKESGYKGERVVIINPTDFASVAPLGQVTADLLKQAGFNVDLQDMDWGSVLQRRTSREPVDKGGWSIFHTTWPSVAIANPVLNTNTRGKGEAGWFGWFEDAETERLASEWLVAKDPAEQERLFVEAQRRALETMPIALLGQFKLQTAIRKSLQGFQPGSAVFFWGIHRV